MPLFEWGGDLWSPFREMQRELNRLMGRGAESQLVGGSGYPPINIYDGEDHMVVLAEVPGVPMDQLDLSITDDTLVIKGTKPADNVANERYHRRERGSGDFSRTIVLPERVDAEKIQASVSRGVLRIELPKSEASRPKRIAVEGS
jgi:HSP20 family protein